MSVRREDVKDGDMFGSWAVVDSKALDNRITVVCECGTTQNVRPGVLLNGTSRECRNCLRRERRLAPFTAKKKLTDEQAANAKWERDEIDKWLEHNTPTQL